MLTSDTVPMALVGKMTYTVAVTGIVEGGAWAVCREASRKDHTQADPWRGQVSPAEGLPRTHPRQQGIHFKHAKAKAVQAAGGRSVCRVASRGARASLPMLCCILTAVSIHPISHQKCRKQVVGRQDSMGHVVWWERHSRTAVQWDVTEPFTAR